MSGDWYVLQGGKERGPFSREQLQALARAQKLNPGARVRKGTEGSWIAASEVRGLFPWIDEARSPDRSTPEPAPAARVSSHWKLGLAIAATALLSTTIAVIACVMLLRGGDDADAAVVASRDQKQADNRRIVFADDETERPVVERPPVVVPPVEPSEKTEDQGPPDDQVRTPVAAEENEPAPKPDPQPEDEPVQIAEEQPERPELDPKPLLPAIPDEKVEITDSEISHFDKDVQLELKAKDAYARYEVFAQSYAFTDEQRERVDAELAEWKQRAEEGLHRLGFDWVTLEEVQEAEEEADRLLDQADALARVGSWEGCMQKLEEANRANPNGIMAAYWMGLNWSLPFTGMIGPDNAERYFRTVLLRQPNHAGALNSMAIAQIKQRHHGPALQNFARSADLSERCPEVIQNVGRFIFLAESGRVPTQRSVLNRYTDLYAELIAEEKGPEFDPTIGWRHIRPVFPARERNEPQAKPFQVAAVGERLEARFVGTGFVIAPGYVMTNRHVVEDDTLGVCDVVGIVDPNDPQNELRGTMFARSETTDLAIVHFPKLDATPLKMQAEVADLASDIWIFGFPRDDVLGTGLKATRGVISALPDETREGQSADYYILDATSDSGNSGGPVLNRRGFVVAVLQGGYREGISVVSGRVFEGIDAELSLAVTSDMAAQFASDRIERFDLAMRAPAVDPNEDWGAIVARISPSVFRLTCYYKAGVPALEVAANAAGYQNSMEDRTCPTCDGRTRLPCPRQGCLRGEITIRFQVTQRGAFGQVIRTTETRKETCPVCRGAGSLDCPHCVNGVDAHLR